MPNGLQAFVCLCVADAGSISQSVQDRNDGAAFTDQSKLTDQLRDFLRVDVIVITGPVLAHDELCVNAAGPVQLEMYRGRIILRICYNFFKDRPKSAFLQSGRRVRVIPQSLQIITKREPMIPLFGKLLRRRGGRFF